ncbi:MAG: ComEC family competence protein [Candidatus Omnitrophica bacterium]|nr:ComEC family competence protein [Candidatus Omnitrophota bacterium]
MNRPLPLAFILLVAGIIFAYYIKPFFVPAVAVTALLVILLFVFNKRNRIIFYAVSSALVFLLGVLSLVNFNTLPSNHISKLLKDDRSHHYIEAVVVSSPEYYWMRSGRRKASFFAEALSYKDDELWIGARGKSLVNIWDNENDILYGERILLFGTLKTPYKNRKPDEFNYAEYLKRKGIYTIIDVRRDDDVEGIRPNKAASIKGLIFDARSRIESLIRRHLRFPDGAIVNAMLIGKRSYLTKELNELFIKTGTAHIVSVSGLHVAVISAILFFILRMIGIPRKISCVLVFAFLIVYAIIAGQRIPIIRAVIMISIYLLSYILERDFDIYSTLSLAGIIILIYNPMQLFSAGFILSFACVFSICYLTPKLSNPLFSDQIRKWGIGAYAVRIVLVSIAVYIGIMPIIAYFFSIISPITIIANIFVVPLLGVILFLAILFLVTTAILPALGVLIGLCLHGIISVLIKGISLLSEIPLGYFYIENIPLYLVVIYYILLFAVANRRYLLGLRFSDRTKH